MKVRPSKKSTRRLIILGAVVAFLSGIQLGLGAKADDTALERPGFSLITRDGSGDAGQYSSIAIGADGLGLISYYDATNGDLKVAHCIDLACGSAGVNTLHSKDSVGRFTSITIGADVRGLISYYDATNGDLRVAHCADIDCQSATHTVVQSQNDVGQFTAITIGTDGRGLISYYDATNGDLKVAHCSNSFCVPYHRR